jgi:SAM-dependent methyltransferase
MNDAHKFCDSPEWRLVVREQIIPWALGSVELGDDLLEIGPGYGATTEVFAQIAPHVTSVEIDPTLAARLRSRSAGGHVDVVLGDATRLCFPDACFSGAVCFSMLHHVPSPELQDRLFSEAARVLRSGTPMIAVDSVESAELRIHHEGDTYQPIDPDSLPDRLREAGFSEVEVRINAFGWTALART